MERDEAAIEAVIAQLPSVIQGVINLQRDARIAAELLTEPVFTDGSRIVCCPIYAWTQKVGRHNQEWYGGYTRVVNMYRRVVAERSCSGPGGEGRIRVVALRYVFEVLYGLGPGHMNFPPIARHPPCYDQGDPIDFPPTNITYEEYIELWKL